MNIQNRKRASVKIADALLKFICYNTNNEKGIFIVIDGTDGAARLLKTKLFGQQAEKNQA